jgi:hypothetical protein
MEGPGHLVNEALNYGITHASIFLFVKFQIIVVFIQGTSG